MPSRLKNDDEFYFSIIWTLTILEFFTKATKLSSRSIYFRKTHNDLSTKRSPSGPSKRWFMTLSCCDLINWSYFNVVKRRTVSRSSALALLQSLTIFPAWLYDLFICRYTALITLQFTSILHVAGFEALFLLHTFRYYLLKCHNSHDIVCW